jgi:hypothetical protein
VLSAKLRCGLSLPTAMGALAALALTGCAAGSSSPDGYSLIGSTDGATLYARRESGARLSVVVTGNDGKTLCNASGPMSPDKAPPVCDGTADGTYAYVLQVRKVPNSVPQLCNGATGTSIPAAHIGSPQGWPVDFVLAVGPSAGVSSVGTCPR